MTSRKTCQTKDIRQGEKAEFSASDLRLSESKVRAGSIVSRFITNQDSV